MKFTTSIALLAGAASTTLAAPLEARHDSASPFELEISFSNSPLNGAIQANGGSFWYGKDANTYCPDNVGSSCPTGNTTAFRTNGDGTLSLSTVVPGGQQVYIAPNGLLSYTQAHSAAIPTDSHRTGFEVDSTNLFSKFYEFWLCSQDEDYKTYNVWVAYRDDQGALKQNGATGSNTCTRINLLAKDTASKDAQAWQYN